MTSTSKKLSIEERLSLAAKAKSKRKGRKAGFSASPPPVPESLTVSDNGSIHESQTKELAETEENNANIYVDVLSRILPSDYQDLSKEALLEALGPILVEQAKSYSQLSSEVKLLREKSSVDAQFQPNDSILMKLIKEKDEKINQLLREGENLSKIELQQSNIIKSLRSNIKDLEFALETHKDDLSVRIKECESLHEEIRGLRAKTENYKIAAERAEKERIDAILKYETLQTRTIQPMTEELQQRREETERLKVQLQRANDANETNQFKANIKYEALQETSQEEITRLETSLEQLRIEVDKHPSEVARNDVPGSNSQEIISAQYKALEEQLKNSKENWSTIEFSLNSRLTELQSHLSDVEILNSNLEEANKNLRTENESLCIKISSLQDDRKILNGKVNMLQEEVSKINGSLKESSREYDLLNKKYQLQKAHLENSIFTEHTASRQPSEGVLSNDGIAELPQNFQNIDEISQWDLQNNNSINHSLLNNDEEEIDDHTYDLGKDPAESIDLESFHRKSSLTSLNLVSSQHITTTRSQQSNQMNAQMISRLGGEVRRLETELSSFKESYERLQKEKLKANDNIIKLMEENELVHEIQNERTKLLSQVENLEQKLNMALQLLGEKSERVEELENDVDDLKEMLQMQVQQIVELQEKVR